MTTVRDISNYIESLAPLSTAESWDNCGLIVGENSTEVSRCMLCLDITDEVVADAHSNGCQLIISHHPVIFDGLKSIDRSSVIYSLLKNNISALCMHTNLDIAKGIGVNACLANAIGLESAEMIDGQFLCVGKLNTPMSSSQFAKHVKSRLGCGAVKYTDAGNICVVGVSSGAGGDSIELYKKYGLDALVTGEVKHHQFLYAKAYGLCVVEAGHFSTEDVVIKPLIKNLAEQFSGVDFLQSSADTDPVCYA